MVDFQRQVTCKTTNVRPGVRSGVRPGVRPDGRRQRLCRQRRRKKNHLIQAALFGPLDQMLRTTERRRTKKDLIEVAKRGRPRSNDFFFGAADDTRATRTSGRTSGQALGRPNVRPDARRHARPDVPQTLTKNRFTNSNYGNRRYGKSYEKLFPFLFSKVFRIFGSFRSFKHVSRNRSRRDDSFGPKIVGFRAILAIFRPFEDRNQTE